MNSKDNSHVWEKVNSAWEREMRSKSQDGQLPARDLLSYLFSPSSYTPEEIEKMKNSSDAVVEDAELQGILAEMVKLGLECESEQQGLTPPMGTPFVVGKRNITTKTKEDDISIIVLSDDDYSDVDSGESLFIPLRRSVRRCVRRQNKYRHMFGSNRELWPKKKPKVKLTVAPKKAKPKPASAMFGKPSSLANML